MKMLDLIHDHTIALDAIAWPKVTGIAVDRIATETWSDYIVDGQPAEGATLLDSGHVHTTMVIYADGKWDVVGWSETHEEMQALAFRLAMERDLSVTYYPALIRHLRTQIN
jgi:hypothetical protein